MHSEPVCKPLLTGRDNARIAKDFSHLREFIMQGVDPKLLEILVCPLTKGPLHYDEKRQELVSDSARLAYPIRDGIPIMLAEEARRMDD